MSKELIIVPANVTKPDWVHYGKDDDGINSFKIQVLPSIVAGNKVRGTILKIGRRYFKLIRSQQLPGAPSDPPRQSFRVWGVLVAITSKL